MEVIEGEFYLFWGWDWKVRQDAAYITTKAANYFHKKAPSYMFDWLQNTSLGAFCVKKA